MRCGWHLVVGLVFATAPASAQQAAIDFCRAPAADLPSADLYCLELIPAPGMPEATAGHLALDFAPSPFTVPVNRHGAIRYQPRLYLSGLPVPSSIDSAATTFVAWAATPLFSEWHNLGEVSDGLNRLGEVDLEQFMVVVSAEVSGDVDERTGPLVLRGGSPSTRLQPPDFQEFAAGVVGLSADQLLDAGMAGDHAMRDSNGWSMFPTPSNLMMLPAMMLLRPNTRAGQLLSADGVEAATKSVTIQLAEGDSLTLVADRVVKSIHGTGHVMLGFNGQVPGPLLVVNKGTEVHVRFINRLDQPSSVHWHGLRLDHLMDGAPPVSQPAVQPGDTFDYTVRFPDAGVYWYHPHVRGDRQQDLGLAGNIAVTGMTGLPEVGREELLIVDDILIGHDGLVPFGEEQATHAMMGRFGNQLLVNGEPLWRSTARSGEKVRIWFTNAANTRTFNLSVDGASMNLVAADMGAYDEPHTVESVVLAPAERYAVDVVLEGDGPWYLVNRVRGLDHLAASFFAAVDTLGVIQLSNDRQDDSQVVEMATASGSDRMQEALEAIKADEPTGEPWLTLEFGLRVGDLPFVTQRLMMLDSAYFHPVEWTGSMPMMNWASTPEQVEWFVRDAATGLEDAEASFAVKKGDTRVIRLVNVRNSIHAMQHPVHVHGQRFKVLAVNGQTHHAQVWKDTVLLPAGGTVDILVEFTNPGRWMLHCHIAEHIEAGMMTTFTVEE